MKNSKSVCVAIGILISIAVLVNGCKEVGPVLPWGHTHVLSDTTYVESPPPSPQSKNALIELFTGITCPNCPPADSIMNSMVLSSQTSAHQVIGVALHSLFQDDSIPGATNQSMTNPGADNLLQFFGGLIGKPCGAVDRIYHSSTVFGPGSILDAYSAWSGYLSTEFGTPTQVNLTITAETYTPTSKQIALTVKIEYVVPQTDSNRLSIFLTEDSIITGQELPSRAIDTFFVHNHVFRDAVTNIEGDPINVSAVAGTVDIKTYAYTITNARWNPAHLYLVAFVNENQSQPTPLPPILNVLQTQIVKVQ